MAHLLEGSDLVTAAKNIRAELAEAFPGVKFSIRSRRFSGGNAIDVSWQDGPTSKAVDAIANKYKDGDFDGMTDSYNYRHDGWTEKHGGAKYIGSARDYSPAMIQAAIEALVAEYGAHDVPTVEDWEAGRAWKSPLAGSPGNHWDWQSLIGRKLSDTAA